MSHARFNTLFIISFFIGLAASPIHAQQPPPSPPAPVVPAAPSTAKASDENTTITLNLNNVPIEQLVKFLSDTTGKPVIKQKDINTQISVMSPVPISKRRALELIYDSLQLENIYVVDLGDKLQIVSAATIKGMALQSFDEKDDIQAMPDSIRIVRKVYHLKNTTTDNLKVHLDKFVPDAAITLDPKSNTIILTDQLSRLKIYDRIVQSLDSVNLNDRVVEVFHLQYADSVEIAILIGNIMTNSTLFIDAASSDAKSRSLTRGLDAFQSFSAQSKTARGTGAVSVPLMIGDVTLVPDPRSNSLIISCPKARLEELSRWVHDFDKEQKLDVQVRVIDVRYVEARAVAQAISDLFRDQAGTSAKDIVRAVPTDQGNNIFVLSSQKNYDLIQGLVKQFDTEDAVKQETRTYIVKNLEAKDLADQLSSLYGDTSRRGGSYYDYYYSSGSSSTAARAKFVSSPRTNSLMVLANPREFEFIEKMIKELDVPVDKENFLPRVYRIHNTDANEMLKVLTSLFEKSQTSARSSPEDYFWRPVSQTEKDALEALYGKIHFVVDTVTNTIVALASNRKNYEIIDKLIEQLDKIDPDSASVLIVDLKYAKAVDVADQVNNLLSDGPVQRPAQANQQQQTSNTNSSSNNNNQTQTTQAVAETVRDIIYPWQAGQSSQSKTTQQQPINRMIGNVRAVPDNRSNKIVITAQPMYFPALRDLIMTLDRQEPEVHISTKMVEVVWGKERRIGLRWTPDPRSVDPAELDNAILGIARLGFLDAFGRNGAPTTVTSQTSPATDSGSIDRTVLSTVRGGNTLLGGDINLALLLQLLLKNSNSRIVSQPEITVSNNEMGNIFVGSEFPFRTNTQTNDRGGLTFGIEYRKVGINVDITPHINIQGEIVLKVMLENSKIREGEFIDGQIIKDERSFHTELAVESGQTIVIGGIMLKNEGNVERRVPILGSIPGISWAFKKRDISRAASELLVFITPEVMRNRADADRLLEQTEKRLRRFDELRQGNVPPPDEDSSGDQSDNHVEEIQNEKGAERETR